MFELGFERSFLIEIVLFLSFFNILLKTSVHCTLPCDSKATNCQLILSYVNKNQSSTIMKAAYKVLLYFILEQVLPQLFSFLNMATPHEFSFSSCSSLLV